jgi:puromycin-sensitive aminopeptidase
MSALQLDALHSSHPIEVPVGHPSEIDEIFDDISYSKGASVIRMLHRYLGDADFRKGMSLYLNRFKYQNTQTEDLWAALGETSGKPVREVMASWTKQKGFPLISVDQKQDGTNRILTLSQSKFVGNGKVSEAEKDLTWMVPITIITASSPNTAVLVPVLSNRSAEVVVPNVASSEWVKLNQDSVGVYRVQYSPEMLHDLLPAVESKVLQPIDRLSLHTDLFALVQAGKNSTTQVLQLLEAFKEEDQYSVWSGITPALGEIGAILDYTDFHDAYNVWGRRLMMPLFSKVGWQPKAGEKHTDSLLRSLTLARLAVFAEPTIIAEARKLFDSHVRGVQVIPADIRAAVYAAISRNATDSEFDSFFKLYRETEQHEEKSRILRSLGAVKQNSQIDRVLKFSISDEVRSQDAISGIASCASSKAGREMAWSFLKENHKLLVDRYSGSLLISRLVSYLI